MKKLLIISLIILACATMVVLLVAVDFKSFTKPDQLMSRMSCRILGEGFEFFSNTCADTCGVNSACGMGFTESCNCGPGKCWDGFLCVDDKHEEEFNKYNEFCQELGLRASYYGSCEIFNIEELGCFCDDGLCWDNNRQTCIAKDSGIKISESEIKLFNTGQQFEGEASVDENIVDVQEVSLDSDSTLISNVQHQIINQKEVEITWDTNSDYYCFVKYHIYLDVLRRDIRGETLSLVYAVDGGKKKALITNLQPNTQYYYQVDCLEQQNNEFPIAESEARSFKTGGLPQ